VRFVSARQGFPALILAELRFGARFDARRLFLP
jgi:hypothetical protein